MKKLIISLSAFLFALPIATNAQKLVLEKTYEVDRKAKRGYLDEVTTNSADKTTTLSFVTRSSGNFTGSKTKVKYQNYIFDKDYNFVKVEEKEEEYRNKKFKTENYSVEGITVETNMLAKMVLRKKLIEYNWSWFNGEYNKKVTLLDKVKPKDEEGNSYMLIKKFENEEAGGVIALVSVVFGKGANPNEYIFMKIDKDLKTEIVDKHTFTAPKSLIKSFIIPAEVDENDEEEVNEDDISKNDMCFIFAGAPTGKKDKESGLNYEMWRVSKQGKILSKIEFKVLAPEWSIESVIAKSGSLYFVGPADDEKSSKPADERKWKYYQLAKITGNKLDYVTTTNMDDFEAKLKKPASQKKNPAYKGKRFRFATANVGADGSLFICGQNFQEKSFDDVLMFYFDNAGKLKAQYGVRLEERNDEAKLHSTRQYIDITGSSAYWTVFELAGFRKEAGNGEKPKSLIYPSTAKIELSSGDIGEFVKFGTVKEKPTYYLQNKYPFLINPADHSQIFLGVDKKGDVLWFGKVVLE